MRTWLLRLLILATLPFPAPLARGADAPLPKGALARFGPEGLVFRSGGRVTLAPDGKTLLLPDQKSDFRRFDVITGKPLDKRGPATGPAMVYVVASGDGKRVAMDAGGNTIVRDADTGEQLQELKPPGMFFTTTVSEAPTTSFSFDGKVLARSGTGRDRKSQVIVWDVEKSAVLFQTEIAHPGPAVPILSADGKMLAVRPAQTGFPRPAEMDAWRTVRVWDVPSGKELFQAKLTPALSSSGVAAVVFSPDGSLLAGSCGDGAIDVWDVKTGKEKFTLLGRTRQGARLAFSPDGKVLAAMTPDGAVQRWSVADEKPLGTHEAPAVVPVNNVQGLIFVDQERLLGWGMVGPCPVVWEVLSGKMLSRVPDHTDLIRSIGFPTGGKEIVTAGVDGRVMRWDIETGKRLREVTLRPGRAQNFCGRIYPNLTPDGRWALALGNPTMVFDLDTGAEEFTLPLPTLNGALHTPATTGARVIRLVVPSDTKKPAMCVIWDLAKRRKVSEVELELERQFVPQVALSPDGTRLVIATMKSEPGQQPTLVVTGWDTKTGKKLGQVEDTNGRYPTSIIVVSNATAIVASGSRLRAFDYEFGRGGDVIESEALSSGTWPVGVSSDGKRFACGVRTDNEFGVRVFDWPSGKALHTFSGHRSPAIAVAFSPDGKMLATSSEDTVVLVWDLTAIPQPK